MKKYESNKLYLARRSWQGVWNQLKKRKGASVWVTLKLTPSIDSAMSCDWAAGIRLAKKQGYLDMKASLDSNNLIRLSALIDQNMGDEDGFGVEPDDYLVGTVTHDGTIVEPLGIR